jgi:hypothetical protein
MPPLLLPGYWPTTYFPRGHWEPDYWPHFNLAISGGETGRWQPVRLEWYHGDDDEVLVILG